MIAPKIELKPEHFGQKWVIFGKSGSGKSHTARTVIEEGVKLGVTFTVIDPQEAYLNLPGFFYISAKKVSRSKDLGILLAASNKNVVIETKKLTPKEQEHFVKNFLEGFRVNGRKGIRTIIIDECHKFAPEKYKAESKQEVLCMSQENRSDGLGFIAVEQRPARLDKTIVSEADLLIIHRVTSSTDTDAISDYLDNPKSDIPKITRLNVGEASFYGFSDAAVISQVRKAETEHSGSSPKNLLTEDSATFNYNIKKVYKGGNTMTDQISEKGEPVKGVVPSMDGFFDLVGIGAKMSIGLGVAGFVGAFASRWKSPIPYISTRTLASGATTILLYAGYRNIKQPIAKDVMKYAAAGAAVHTAGSLVYDILALTKINVPPIVNFGLMTMTGVPPIQTEGTATGDTGEEADLNTKFA